MLKPWNTFYHWNTWKDFGRTGGWKHDASLGNIHVHGYHSLAFPRLKCPICKEMEKIQPTNLSGLQSTYWRCFHRSRWAVGLRTEVQWQEDLELEKILRVCNQVLFTVTCKQQQRELVCRLSHRCLSDLTSGDKSVTQRMRARATREGNKTRGWGEPLRQNVSKENFVPFCSPQKNKNLKMRKKEIKRWKETSKSDIEKSNSLLQFFSDKIYWANKNN